MNSNGNIPKAQPRLQIRRPWPKLDFPTWPARPARALLSLCLDNLRGIVLQAWASIFALAFTLAGSAPSSFAEERATAAGRVVDADGTPLENATVMVFSAAVKKGYSLFCPTCYRDCGKRTLTGVEGRYAIRGLDPELSFTLVAVKDGYLAAYIWNVDPAAGPAPDANLTPRPAVKDLSQIVRGKVVDTRGQPLSGALVQPDIAIYKRPDGHTDFSAPMEWINGLTVTNDKGEFEVAFRQPAMEMTIRVTARGMAPKHFTLPTGGERKTLMLDEGAVILGRLVYDGKPVAGAEVGLVPHDAGVGRWYPEVRIGTAQDGTFAITNVPPGRIWLLIPMMESLADRGIGALPVICETKYDRQELKLGDIPLKQAHTLRGKVVLDGAKPIPPEMRVTITADRSSDTQVVKISSDGRFRFDGLPDGLYAVSPAVKGYRLADDCPISLCRSVEILVNADIKDFVIRMEREPEGAAQAEEQSRRKASR